MDTKAQSQLTSLQYWWVFAVSLLGPLLSIWIESAWVFRREIRHYQALIFYFDNPGIWIVYGLEYALTAFPLIVLRQRLHSGDVRWGIVCCLYVLWTCVAFLIMPGVHR